MTHLKKNSYIHIYTGDGKGKTTAAMGLAMRALGWGMKVCIFHFLKKGMGNELKLATSFNGRLKIVTFDQRHPIFLHKSLRHKAAEDLRKRLPHDLRIAKETILMGSYDMIILDEVINCLNEKFIDKKDILPIVSSKFLSSELILTGRGAPKWLISKADYVTEMRLVKHPYQKGRKARKGIEY